MLRLVPIEVRTYSAGKAEELPESFTWGDIKVEIVEITDRWYQGDNNPGFAESDYYKVTGPGNADYLLKHEMENDLWFICLSE
jgi:hypothetical protein